MIERCLAIAAGEFDSRHELVGLRMIGLFRENLGCAGRGGIEATVGEIAFSTDPYAWWCGTFD